jgi:hypothetical protein
VIRVAVTAKIPRPRTIEAGHAIGVVAGGRQWCDVGRGNTGRLRRWRSCSWSSRGTRDDVIQPRREAAPLTVAPLTWSGASTRLVRCNHEKDDSDRRRQRRWSSGTLDQQVERTLNLREKKVLKSTVCPSRERPNFCTPCPWKSPLQLDEHSCLAATSCCVSFSQSFLLLVRWCWRRSPGTLSFQACPFWFSRSWPAAWFLY